MTINIPSSFILLIKRQFDDLSVLNRYSGTIALIERDEGTQKRLIDFNFFIYLHLEPHFNKMIDADLKSFNREGFALISIEILTKILSRKGHCNIATVN